MSCFSPDSKYLFTGCEKANGVVIFDIKTTKTKVHELKGHPTTPTCLAWSREHLLLVSACHNVLFWVPDHNKISL